MTNFIADDATYIKARMAELAKEREEARAKADKDAAEATTVGAKASPTAEVPVEGWDYYCG